MSHPYGKKVEITVTVNETNRRVMERGGTPLTAFHFKGRPSIGSEQLVQFLLSRGYCAPWDLIHQAFTFTRRKGRTDNIIVKIETESDDGESGKKV